MDRIEELRDLVSEVHRRIASLNRESKVLNSIQAITTRMSGVNHLEQEETLRQQILSGSPPDYALAHYALFLIGARLFDEAQQYLNLASEVDPFEISPDEIWSYRADIATPAEEVLIRKLQLQERPNHIGILGTVGRNLALEGRLDEARSYIDHQRELDTEGVSAHLTAVVVGVLDGTINADSKDSAELEQHYALGPDYNFSNGVLAFMLGDFAKGKEFWTQLQPIQKRRLRNLVYAVEKFFPHEILECDCYQLMLEDLGVGKSWQHTLMRGVIEMETATGVSLSDSARRALAEDRLMSRNNLWPDSVWSSIESKLP
jgi:tetratricopeptide (TPR) repeat protein